MKQLFIFIVFILFSFVSITQEPISMTIGEQELSNIDIYSLLYDENTDILYITSNEGVYQYKQNKFMQLVIPNDVIGNSFFSLQQKSTGEIFCKNHNGQIFEIIQDSLQVYFERKVSNDHYPYFFINKKDEIVFANDKTILLIDSNKNEVNLLLQNKLKIESSCTINNACQLKTGEIFISFINDRGGYYIIDDDKISKYFIDFKTDYSYAFKLDTNLFFLNSDLDLFDFNNMKTELFDLLGYSNLRFYKNSNISLGITNGVSQLQIRDNKLINKNLYKKNFFSNWTFNNDLCFFGTFKEGIRITPKINQATFNFNEELLQDILVKNDSVIYASTRKGNIYKISSSSSKSELFNSHAMNVDKLFYLPNFSELFPYYKKDIFFYTQLFPTKNIIKKDSVSFFSFWKTKLRLNTFETQKSKKRILKQESYFTDIDKIKDIKFDNKEQVLYICSNKNTYKLDKDKSKTNLYFKGNSFSSNVLFLSNSSLYCGTQNDGVLIFKNDTLKEEITIKTGLKSNSIKELIRKDSVLYILNSGSLQLYNLNTKTFIPFGFQDGS